MNVEPGSRNLITDVSGILVGNAEDATVRTGTTVVLPDGEARLVASVSVLGGGPGTRETDALAAGRLVESVDALVLSGGSAYGLDAASAVHGWLGAMGRGFDTGQARVPIVPAAILYDLANGGDKSWGAEAPYHRLGRAAAKAAGMDFALGKAGAGYGARAGSVEGGLGSASAVDPETGVTVGALVAVNSFGDAILPDGRFYAAPFEQNKEFGGLGPWPTPAPVDPVFPKLGRIRTDDRQNTTIAAIATDAAIDRLQMIRIVDMAQAGFARALRPVYSPFDGDMLFGLASGRADTLDVLGMARIGAIAADCVARAIARGVYEAQALDRGYPSWHDRFGTYKSA